MYQLSAEMRLVCRQEPDDASGSQMPPQTADQSSDHENASKGTGENAEENKKPFPLFGAKLDAVGYGGIRGDSYYSRESYENLVSILNNDNEKTQTFKDRPAQLGSAPESGM